MENFNFYICPNCKKKFNKCKKLKECYFKLIDNKIPCFTKIKISKTTNYEVKQASLFYKNFLDWLFGTFKTNEKEFRKTAFKDINFKKNQKVLITGSGNGDDIKYIIKNYKSLKLKIFAQDLSTPLMLDCSKKLKRYKNIFFNISNAKSLPFENGFFDHCFQFGGINLFGNFKKSIQEMERVTKIGGSITFGDEGIGLWLRDTIYSDMLTNNNKLWKFKFNLKNITLNANNVSIRYLLGNCFYVVNYVYDPDYKNRFNYEIIHKSPRGGSILTRYISKKKFNKNFILRNLNKNCY